MIDLSIAHIALFWLHAHDGVWSLPHKSGEECGNGLFVVREAVCEGGEVGLLRTVDQCSCGPADLKVFDAGRIVVFFNNVHGDAHDRLTWREFLQDRFTHA